MSVSERKKIGRQINNSVQFWNSFWVFVLFAVDNLSDLPTLCVYVFGSTFHSILFFLSPHSLSPSLLLCLIRINRISSLKRPNVTIIKHLINQKFHFYVLHSYDRFLVVSVHTPQCTNKPLRLHYI